MKKLIANTSFAILIILSIYAGFITWQDFHKEPPPEPVYTYKMLILHGECNKVGSLGNYCTKIVRTEIK